MKIVYAVPYPVTGAVGQRVTGLIQGLLSTNEVSHVTIMAPSHDITVDKLENVSFSAVEIFPPGPRRARERAFRRLMLGRDTVRVLDKMQPRPGLVLAYAGGSHLYVRRLQQWASHNRVKVAADVVEWYDSSHLPLGRFGPYALDNYLMMTRSSPKSDGIVAISSYLEQHYREAGNKNIVRIPPTTDTSKARISSTGGTGRVELVYCGNPGKKDRLDIVLKSVIDFDPQGQRIRFTIAGPSLDELTRLAQVETLPPVINAAGRVSQQEAISLLQHADWMPLLRDNKRFASAGFPTKVAEALTTGTPVIANLTSDLSEVLLDGVTGIEVLNPNTESMKVALERATKIGRDERFAMSKKAKQLGDRHFDFRTYSDSLRDWLRNMNDPIEP